MSISNKICVAGHLPGRTERGGEYGCCAQMANNMGPWTTSAAYHQETNTQVCESPWLLTRLADCSDRIIILQLKESKNRRD